MREINLGSIADVVPGVSYSPRDISSSGIRILRGGNIQNDAIILKQDDVFLVDSYSDESNSVREGDTVVVASTGSTDALGKAATSWTDIPDTQIGAFLRIVRPKERKWAATVSAWLTQPIFSRYIVNRAKGTGINNIKREYFLDYPIYVHDEKDLIKFSRLYEGVDRLIELSRRRIENLEKLAKEIYDYWFVQFDFPDKNGKPYKTSGGKMVYNAQLKREIPAGWEVAGIEDVCSVVDCLHSKKPDYCYEADECYLLTLENLTKNGYVDLRKKFYISRADYDEWTRNIEILENDFVITNAGRAGDICRVRKGVKCAAGRNMTVVRPNGVNPYYLRGYFFSDFMQMQIKGGLEMGSLFANFNVRTIRKLNVIVPSVECKAIEPCLSCLEGIVRLIDSTLDCIDELTQLREFLLPLLMNGQAKFGEWKVADR